MTYRLGVDGGGTKTIAVLAVAEGGQWNELGRGTSAGCNQDGQVQFEQLRMAIDGAFASANVRCRPVSRANFGLAGAGRETVVQEVQQWARKSRIAPECHVVPDVVPLLVDAPLNSLSVALVSGTGSIAWGRAAGCTLLTALADRRRSARAGGLGPLLGDEGSGYWIGLRALQDVARCRGGADRCDSLKAVVQQSLQISSLDELPRIAARIPRVKIAQLAPHVVALWQQQDAAASTIIAQAVSHLASLAIQVVETLGESSLDNLVLAGGVLVHSDQLQLAVNQELTKRGYAPRDVTVVSDAASCAVRL